MKYSRDTSSQYLYDTAELNRVSDEQVKNIAALGATHVAIATPYDDEFLPVLETWVKAARKYNLKIWFRGNWSGWEEWFDYPIISRQQHLEKTVAFIKAHPELFEEGDYFSACPECENGGPGDPRIVGDAEGHRQFLIDEHAAMQDAFRSINRNVQVNLNSMNADVAKLIMDTETTKELGGYVVIDHYVASPEQLDADITEIAERSGGKIILGEFGAPIPDINGSMTEQQQANWIDQSMSLLIKNQNLHGINYWTNVGGTTALWTEAGKAKLAVATVKKYFSPSVVTGKVINTVGNPIKSATLTTAEQVRKTDENGKYTIPYINTEEMIGVTAFDHLPRNVRVDQLEADTTIVMAPESHSWWYSVRLWFVNLFQ
jgi:hypothetical protein